MVFGYILSFYSDTMASKNSSLRNCSRVTPYDKNLPAKWTATNLRSEIAAHGIILISRISKSALLQVYEQLSSRSTLTMGNTNEEPQGTLPVQLTAPRQFQVTEFQQTTAPGPSQVTAFQQTTSPGPSQVTGFQQTTAPGPSQVTGFQQTTVPGPSHVTGFQQTTAPGPSQVTEFKQIAAPGPSQVTGFQQTTALGPSQVTEFKHITAPRPSQVTVFQQTSFLPDRNTLLSALPTKECQTSLLNGTVGMVTAMQGALTSLQATVNNLLQKET